MTRVLVFGDASGDVANVVAKAQTIIKRNGPFSAVLFAGELATEISDLAHLRLSIPCYFTGQAFAGSDSRTELRDANITYVGPAALEVIDGVRVMFLADGYDEPLKQDASTPLPPEVKLAMDYANVGPEGYPGVDIFVCPRAPQCVKNKEKHGDSKKRAGLVERVAAAVRPRYHFFASHSKYVELAPFLCPYAKHGTQVIGIAPATSPRSMRREKWVYAIGITPLTEMTSAQLAATRRSISSHCVYSVDSVSNKRPEGEVVERSRDESGTTVNQYFWSMRQKRGDRQGRVSKRARISIRTPSDAACWFCLANGKDPHLVVSVGNHVYLALAKGGLLPEHVLIIPKAHLKHSLDSQLSTEVADEIERYKVALKQMFAETMRHVPYVFERAIHTHGGRAHMHMQINVIPIDPEEARQAGQIANRQAERCKIKLIEPPQGESCLTHIRRLAKGDKSVNFFWAELPDGVKAVQVFKRDDELLCPIVKDDEDDEKNGSSGNSGEKKLTGQHPLHFGRSIGAALVRRIDRADWKRCVLPESEEQVNARRFMTRFAKYERDLKRALEGQAR